MKHQIGTTPVTYRKQQVCNPDIYQDYQQHIVRALIMTI